MDLNNTPQIQDDIYIEIREFDEELKYYLNVNPDYFSAANCTEEYLELMSRIEDDKNCDINHWGYLTKVFIQKLDDAYLLEGNFKEWLMDTLFNHFLIEKGKDKVVIAAIMELLSNRKFKSQIVRSLLEEYI